MAQQTRKISDLERQISAESLNPKWQKSKTLIEVPPINGNNGTDKNSNGISEVIIPKDSQKLCNYWQ